MKKSIYIWSLLLVFILITIPTQVKAESVNPDQDLGAIHATASGNVVCAFSDNYHQWPTFSSDGYYNGEYVFYKYVHLSKVRSYTYWILNAPGWFDKVEVYVHFYYGKASLNSWVEWNYNPNTPQGIYEYGETYNYWVGWHYGQYLNLASGYSDVMFRIKVIDYDFGPWCTFTWVVLLYNSY